MSRTMNVFARLVEAELTGVGVPTSLGGTGGDRNAALDEVIRLSRSDPEAAAALAAHHCVIAALLAGRNATLRDYRVPALARGDTRGVWPNSAFDDMLQRGTAAVQGEATESGIRFRGPLGLVDDGDWRSSILLCPVQQSGSYPPALSLLDARTDGLRFATVPSAQGSRVARFASLDGVAFREDELVDSDAFRIVMIPELRALHSVVRSWLYRVVD